MFTTLRWDQYLLEAMRYAGIAKAYMVIRDGKWDIPAYLRDGSTLGLSMAYLMMRLPFGVPFTVDQAYPFVYEAIVAFGFPDILFEPTDAFSRLLTAQQQSSADVVLGLYPRHQTTTTDLVEMDASGRIVAIRMDHAPADLKFTWIIAVWTPRFTAFLHQHVLGLTESVRNTRTADGQSPPYEVTMGAVLQAAVAARLHLVGVPFPEDAFVDIGQPEALRRVVQIVGSG